MFSVHCCHSKTQPKGVSTVLNVAGLHAMGEWKELLEDLMLAIKCYGTEATNVTSAHNPLARINRLVLTNRRSS